MRSLLLLLAGFCLFSLCGCDQIEEITAPGPEEVIGQYLSAIIKGNSSEMYDMLSEKDKAVITKNDFIARTENLGGVLAVLLSSATYKVNSVTITDNQARVSVDLTTPDPGPFMAELMGAAFLSAFSGEEGSEKTNEVNRQLKEAIEAKRKDGNLPTVTNTETYELLKESDGWKVFTNEAKQVREKEEREEQEKINKEKQERATQARVLVREARQLKRNKNLLGAKDKYNEALLLESEMVEANEGIEEVNKELAEIKAQQAYIDKVKLYDLKSKYYESLLQGRVPGVKFKIKNTGDRILNKVEVTVYFKDAKGNVIFEEDYRPVNTHAISFTGDDKPLKPNYVWQMERGQFYPAKSVPSEWETGSVSAKITDIEFSD